MLAVLAGYGFAKYRFAGRRLGFAILLGAVMVPATALVIPTFILFSQAGIDEHDLGGDPPDTAEPVRGVPDARVRRGMRCPTSSWMPRASTARESSAAFSRSRCRCMRPAIVTVLLLSVVASWNNYFLPLAMLSDNRLFPVTVGIGLWQGIASANNVAAGQRLWSIIILGSLVSVIPLIIAFLSLQRYWQGGLAIGSLK